MDTSLVSAVLQASPIVQITLLSLVGMSIFCWAVAWSKFGQFKKLKASNPLF